MNSNGAKTRSRPKAWTLKPSTVQPAMQILGILASYVLQQTAPGAFLPVPSSRPVTTK